MPDSDADRDLTAAINKGNPQSSAATIKEAVTGHTGTIIYRGAVMLMMAGLTGVGIPVVMNAGNLLIELSRKVDRVPLQLDAVKSDITILKSDVSGRQNLQDSQQAQQAAAIQRLTADQAAAVISINMRLAELSKEISQMQVQYAVLNAQLETLLESNRRPPQPPRVR